MVKGGRPSASAAMGGAIGASYQRCGGQTSSGGSPVAAPSTAASRPAGSSSGSKDCAGLRAATRKPAARSSVRRRAATHVFPISVPVPTTATTRRGRTPVSGLRARCRRGVGVASRASACNNRLTSSSLCAADSVTRSRLVPTGTVGGRMAGTHRPSCEQRRRRVERRLLAAEDDRDDRARMSGRCESGLRHPVDQRGEAARQGGAFGGAQDTERRERRRGVGRRRRGGEDVRAGPVDDEVDDVAGRRHETAERAQCL